MNVVPLYSPALHEKREDIPLLVEYFCRNFAEENNFKLKKFSPDALEAMTHYPWKGNIRELKNVIERLLIMTDKDGIEPFFPIEDMSRFHNYNNSASEHANSVRVPVL